MYFISRRTRDYSTLHHALLRQFDQRLHIGQQGVAGVERERGERFTFGGGFSQFAHTRHAQGQIIGQMFRFDEFGVKGARGRQIDRRITIVIQREQRR